MMQKEVKSLNLDALGMKRAEVGKTGSKTRIDRLSLPPATKKMEKLPNEPQPAAARLIEIIKDEGMLA